MSVPEYPCLHATGINLYAKRGIGGIVLKINIGTSGYGKAQLKDPVNIADKFKFGCNRWLNKEICTLVGGCFYQTVRFKLRIIYK